MTDVRAIPGNASCGRGALLAMAALLAGSGGARAGGALAVDAAADNHAISPADLRHEQWRPALAAQIGLPVNRTAEPADTTTAGDMRKPAPTVLRESSRLLEWPTRTGAPPRPRPVHAYRQLIDCRSRRRCEDAARPAVEGQVAAPPARYTNPFVCGFPRTSTRQDSYDPTTRPAATARSARTTSTSVVNGTGSRPAPRGMGVALRHHRGSSALLRRAAWPSTASATSPGLWNSTTP